VRSVSRLATSGRGIDHVSVIEFEAAGKIANIDLYIGSRHTRNGSYDEFDKHENGEDLVLMPFTGLRDEDGKEIYEGGYRSLVEAPLGPGFQQNSN
jgi:hypothetical protein